ncbi:hypothetical protein PTKIN_Ptkin08bG0045500 [Pterospermum kingtungense]
MEKKNCYHCQSGNGNENVNTALFTAGIVLFLVCLKRALLLFLIEQWRAWVFLVLNLVLLAIFFTSMNPNSRQISHQETSEKKDEEMKKKRGNFDKVEACKEDDELLMINSKKRSKSSEAEEKLEKEVMVVELEEEKMEPPKLSKEELNERVEAFIAMFRRHLALDGRKGRDKFYKERKQADDMKKKHINFSYDGEKCFVLKVKG